MTDRELLELAAKAHSGLVYLPELGWIHEDPHGVRGSWWNPLADDGDALRLAVKLELDVMCASVQSIEDGVAVAIEAGTNPCAATRRAIVRAAAEIGRSMG